MFRCSLIETSLSIISNFEYQVTNVSTKNYHFSFKKRDFFFEVNFLKKLSLLTFINGNYKHNYSIKLN